MNSLKKVDGASTLERIRETITDLVRDGKDPTEMDLSIDDWNAAYYCSVGSVVGDARGRAFVVVVAAGRQVSLMANRELHDGEVRWR